MTSLQGIFHDFAMMVKSDGCQETFFIARVQPLYCYKNYGFYLSPTYTVKKIVDKGLEYVILEDTLALLLESNPNKYPAWG